MNREIKFRGKRVDNGEWVYGNINYLRDGVFILENDQCGIIDTPDYHHQGMGCGLEDRNITDRYEAMEHGWENAIERQGELLPLFIEVVPETVGQYTGMKAINGDEIWEGDVLNHDQSIKPCVVFYKKRYCQFAASELQSETPKTFQLAVKKVISVVGNIHDNPKFLNQ